jgi:hypothetical protein
MEDTMDILHIEKKGPLVKTLERFHIYNLSKENLQIKDMYTDIHNPKFNLIKDHSQTNKLTPPPPLTTTTNNGAHCNTRHKYSAHTMTTLQYHQGKRRITPYNT